MDKRIKIIISIVVILILSIVLYYSFIYSKSESYIITNEIRKLERILKDEDVEIIKVLKNTVDKKTMTSLNDFTNGYNRNGALDREYIFPVERYFQVHDYYLYQVLKTDLIPMFNTDANYNIYYFSGERK